VGVKTATRLPISKIVADYVLSPFDPEEKDLLKQILETTKNAVDVILKDGIERAMNRFNK
ncbi:MAG TPA: aminoacyl-tRNA hydrolase, partial [Deltaproteobacteria bacterium]|nr:aminoacyl-tRNA hydrolase [Deltaproteobacteria bacterium]